MAKTYFKKYTGKSLSLVDAMKAVGVKNPSLAYRKKIGKLNGITNAGTAHGNAKMLRLLKKGKLIKSKTATAAKKKTKKPAIPAATKNAAKFLAALQAEHKFIKAHGKKFFYSSAKSKKTFAAAKKTVLAGKKTGITCVVPTRWGLRTVGIDASGFYGKSGHITGYKKSMSKYLKRIKSGKPIGMTLKKAVDKGLLHPGDILCFAGLTHTVTYTGKGYLVFDGGGAAQSRGYQNVGITLDYSKVGAYKAKKISEIVRWK